MQNINRRQALSLVAGTAVGTGFIATTVQAQMPMQMPMMPFGGSKSGAEFPAVGQTLSLVDVPLLDGGVFKPSQAKGKILVMYWWASWCPFCAMQSPHMEKLWQTQRSKGLQLLTLSIDSKVEAATNYLQRKGYTFPAGFMSPELEKKLPKPRGLPVTVIVGRDGKILKIQAGAMDEFEIEDIAKLI